MVKNKCAVFVSATLIGSSVFFAPVAGAQPGASAPSAASQKEARKAQRKAARAKKNAELKELEKQGYQPGGAQPTYPENVQDAQRKAQVNKTAPASAP